MCMCTCMCLCDCRQRERSTGNTAFFSSGESRRDLELHNVHGDFKWMSVTVSRLVHGNTGICSWKNCKIYSPNMELSYS